jgi:predicted nucleic acid-binding Zn ribbon protein
MAEKAKKRDGFVHIGEILQEALRGCRPQADGELVRIWRLWDEAVGDAVAENTRPAAFKGKLLIVHVSSSPWAHQLQFMKQDILRKVNAALGKDLVADIKFKIGPL